MQVIFWTFWAIAAACLTMAGINRIRSTMRALTWLRKFHRPSSSHPVASLQPPRIVAVLPVFREQPVLEETLHYFSTFIESRELDQLIVVSNNKERAFFPAYATTDALARAVAKKINAALGHDCVTVVESSRPGSQMKHQVNDGIRDFLRTLKKAEKSAVYLSIYNADSRPHKETFAYVLKYCRENHPLVLQQNAIHLLNFDQLPSGVFGELLRAGAFFQTRWTMEEIEMQRRQSEYWKRSHSVGPGLLSAICEPLAYCIGHGAFFRADVWEAVGGFPEECELDDLPLGFVLTGLGVPIEPIPVLENCEFPLTLGDFIRQRANWYRGMSGYWRFRAAAIRRGAPGELRVSILAIRSLLRDAASWATISIAVSICLVVAILDRTWWTTATSVLAVSAYGPIASWGVIRALETFRLAAGPQVPVLSWGRALVISLATIPFCLIASLGPWLTLYRKVTGTAYPDHKTLRSREANEA